MKQLKFKDLKEGDYFLFYYSLDNSYYQVNKLIEKKDKVKYPSPHKCKLIISNDIYSTNNLISYYCFDNNKIVYKLNKYEVRGLKL